MFLVVALAIVAVGLAVGCDSREEEDIDDTVTAPRFLGSENRSAHR
jgi:hypothetical protein